MVYFKVAITQWQTFEFLDGSMVAVCGRTFQRLCFGRDVDFLGWGDAIFKISQHLFAF